MSLNVGHRYKKKKTFLFQSYTHTHTPPCKTARTAHELWKYPSICNNLSSLILLTVIVTVCTSVLLVPQGRCIHVGFVSSSLLYISTSQTVSKTLSTYTLRSSYGLEHCVLCIKRPCGSSNTRRTAKLQLCHIPPNAAMSETSYQ